MFKLTEREISLIANNKEVIKVIMDKKYQDIIEILLLEKDPVRSEVLKLWAKECKEMVIALDNFGKKPVKGETPYTGI